MVLHKYYKGCKMSNPINEIERFQLDRNLNVMPYDWENEARSTLEEVFEAKGWNIPKESRKRVFDVILSISDEILKLDNLCTWHPPTVDEKVDAHVDQIVFNIGSIMKLGYNPTIALEEGGKEINSRVGEMVNGKFEKYLGRKYTDLWYKADYKKALEKR